MRLPSIALVLVLLAGLAAACGGSQVSAPGPGVGTRMNAAMPAAILDLPLMDSQGRTRHLSDFRGKVVVVSDSMTLCQETCPLDTASLVHTARTVDAAGAGSKVVFLTITVDPKRDTPAQLAAYRKLYAGSGLPNWMLLTGTPAHITALWKYLGVFTKVVKEAKPPARNWRTGTVLHYDVAHSDEVFFFDRSGAERFILDGTPYIADRRQIPATLYAFLTSRGRHNIGPGRGDWTSGQAVDTVSWLLDRKLM